MPGDKITTVTYCRRKFGKGVSSGQTCGESSTREIACHLLPWTHTRCTALSRDTYPFERISALTLGPDNWGFYTPCLSLSLRQRIWKLQKSLRKAFTRFLPSDVEHDSHARGPRKGGLSRLVGHIQPSCVIALLLSLIVISATTLAMIPLSSSHSWIIWFGSFGLTAALFVDLVLWFSIY